MMSAASLNGTVVSSETTSNETNMYSSMLRTLGRIWSFLLAASKESMTEYMFCVSVEKF